MKKLLLFLAILIAIPAALAVEFPIAELGNCDSQTNCEIYCDNEANIEVCLIYAEKYGLMTKEEVNRAVGMLIYIKNGETPGKCKTEKECNDYCNNEANIDECIDFALKIGEITLEEAEMGKKTKGIGPGGCKRDECKDYCNDASHFSECVDFSVQNGMMDAKEADMVKKTGGKGPGNCKGKADCDRYCETHNVECADFALQYGLMSAADAEYVKHCPKSESFSPECKAFCYSSSDNFEACTAFAAAHGHPENPRDRIGFYESPGGCKGDEKCINDYCRAGGFEEQDECGRFEVKMGFKTEEEYEKWKGEAQGAMNQEELKQKREEMSEYCKNPDNLFECWKMDAESGMITAEDYGKLMEDYEKNKEEARIAAEQADMQRKTEEALAELERNKEESGGESGETGGGGGGEVSGGETGTTEGGETTGGDTGTTEGGGGETGGTEGGETTGGDSGSTEGGGETSGGGDSGSSGGESSDSDSGSSDSGSSGDSGGSGESSGGGEPAPAA